MKYIIIQTEFNLPAAIMFAEHLEHKTVANGHKVLSAGFCNSLGETWGHSESLGIDSKASDSDYIKMALNC